MKDGNIYKISKGKEHTFEHLKKGVYHVEADLLVRLRFRPWVYTNSIRVI